MTNTSSADSVLSGWQKGILVQSRYNTDFSSGDFQQSMRTAAADGVNHVSLVVLLRQSSLTSSDVYVPDYAPTDKALADGIKFIHSLGMQASVSVHVDPNDGQWRALINPNDRPSWFANYGQQLNHYADIAQATNAEELVIATEMSSLTIPSYNSANTPGWIKLIQDARKHYGGLMTYSAQHGGYMSDDQALGFWGSLDEIGISAYYSMGNVNSTVADMKARWAQVDANELSGLANTYKKPLIFTEVGYISGNNALDDPGSAQGNPGGLNLTIQANAYQALLSYWSTSGYMRGASFWDWSSDPNAGGTNDTTYLIQNKPAEQVMKQWFTGNGNGSGNPAQPAAYSTALNSTAAVTTNTPTTTAASVTSSQPLSGVLVDLEIYDSKGNKVAQKYYENQNLTSQASSFQINWTPPADGQYALQVGIFTANWQSNLYWNNATGKLSASTAAPPPNPNPTPTPTPAPTPPASTTGAVTIWWPGDGSGISGAQPFKALLAGVDPSTYTMYWQVDGDRLNAMTDDNTGGAHKQSNVDLSGWNWHGNGGSYVITFVAKDNNGHLLAQKSVTIKIYH